MPIGAIVARYFRQWDPIWFYSHMAIQIFGFLFGLVGFVLGFVVKDFLRAQVTHHKNIGILILILGCLQVRYIYIYIYLEGKIYNRGKYILKRARLYAGNGCLD